MLHVPRGPVELDSIVQPRGDWLGLLVVDGLLAVTLDAGHAHSSWIFGAQDLIRPWDLDDFALTKNRRWQCLMPMQIALLDGDFIRRTQGAPTITRRLVERAAETARWLLAKSLIAGAPRAEERLLLLFTLLAERWGRVCPDGVRLPVPLTHVLLAHMCGVRRPTVTIALRSFRIRGLIYPIGRAGWLLSGSPSEWELAPRRVDA